MKLKKLVYVFLKLVRWSIRTDHQSKLRNISFLATVLQKSETRSVRASAIPLVPTLNMLPASCVVSFRKLLKCVDQGGLTWPCTERQIFLGCFGQNVHTFLSDVSALHCDEQDQHN